eukprot:SAG31_NODE_3631_length_4049_cov_1.835949_1_plen_85_part_00
MADPSDFPGYRAVVRTPVYLQMIQKRCRKGTYTSVDDLLADIRLLLSNCRLYNCHGSENEEQLIEMAQVLVAQAESLVDEVFRD